MKTTEIIILSPPEYVNLVAEMYIGGRYVGWVSREGGEDAFKYEYDGEQALSEDFDVFFNILCEAKDALNDLERVD